MKKGAFQLSLSFIIVVVFAVIVLSLSIAWIQGFFPRIADLTHQVTDIAKDELLNRIAQSDSRVGIAAPDVTAWRRGETGSYAVGIRNIHSDKQLQLSMNVYLEEIGGDLAGENVNAYKTAARNWLTFSGKASPGYSIITEPSGRTTSDIVIQPPTDAKKGIYMFRVVVCEATTCQTIGSANLYGSAQFTLEIKG